MEHFSESTWIRWERERPHPVTCCHRLDRVVHSERTEQDWRRIEALDGFYECFAAVRVVAVDQHSTGTLLPHRIFDVLRSVDDFRLETVELHHQPQQRGDYFLARKNQNVTHSARPKESKTPSNLRTCRFSGAALGSPRYSRNKCPRLSAFHGEGVEKPFSRLPVSALSESTMKELRTALTEQLKRPDGPTQELSMLLRKVGQEAHDKDIKPEQLIIIFKQLWNSLAESLRPQNPDQYELVRQRLVTLCIRAYYAE